MTKLFYLAKVVAINLLFIAVGLIGIELFFGSWFSSTHALYQFTKPRNMHRVQDNPLGNEPTHIRYTRDANGFRGLRGAVSEIDIITVGGSTTDQRYLDDNATYQAVLQDLFQQSGRKLSIANAGIDGQSTVGHIHNFSSWFNQVRGLKARYILYYIGINDILRVSMDDAPDILAANTWRLDWQLYIREKSVFYQIYLIAKRHFEPNPFVHGVTPYVVDVADATAKGIIREYLTGPMRDTLAGLGTRVQELDRLTRQFGAKSIFVTQRSARWTRIGDKVVGIPKYLQGKANEFEANVLGEVNGVDIYHVERLVADEIMKKCIELNAICIDLMTEITFKLPGDFYDHIHTTTSGSKVIGEYLFQKLRGVL
jgi:hypothetical protein